MDIFLSVKVDQDENNDLLGLLSTLQKISVLQSSVKASGSGIEVDVNTKNLEREIDKLILKMEEEFEDTGVDLGISAVKSDTEYIISRLWSVSSPTASNEQLILRYSNLAETSEIANTFFGNMKDDEIIGSRFEGDVGKGKDYLTQMISNISTRLASNLDKGLFGDWEKRAQGLLETLGDKRSDVSSKTIDTIIRIQAGSEEKFQQDVTGIKRGKIKTKDGMTVGSQRGFVGLLNSKERASWEKLISDENRTAYKPSEYVDKEEIYRAGLGKLSKLEEKNLAKRAMAGLDPKTMYIPEGEMMTSEMREEILKTLKKSKISNQEEKIWRSVYQKKLRPDELIQINEKLIQEFLNDSTKDKTEFREKVIKLAKDIYKSEDYAEKIVSDLISAMSLSKQDLENMESFTLHEEWKIFEKYGQALKGMTTYGFEEFQTAVTSAMGQQVMMRDISGIDLAGIKERAQKKPGDNYESSKMRMDVVRLKIDDLKAQIDKQDDNDEVNKLRLKIDDLKTLLEEKMEEVLDGI